ncbi:hypothetical protein LQ50_24290 [Halalkalibacter okhensis]|uniref:Lipoprotein n=1 Tax=Halalkalibacter okhensis TaxID=333138 RepID=A0A0B0I9N0_9BACI|nr:hypothetical protein LQ50_24290 [Halalkalibacter okhensis]
MKKQHVSILFGTCLILASCQADSEAEIVDDIEAQQFKANQQNVVPAPPSIRDQNKQRILRNTALQSYADEAGHYISETATMLESIAPFFDRANVRVADVDHTLSKIQNIRDNSSNFIDLNRPEPFDNMHHVHVSTLMELDALERILKDMKDPVHQLQITNARVYYENAILSHKLMEREYLSVTEDFGIH